VSTTCTVKARGFKAGYTDSDVASASFIIVLKVATPTISPNGGTFTGSTQVTLACSTSDPKTIRYTTNGTDPTSSSTLYSSPFTVSTTCTVKARGFKSGYTDSDVVTANFVLPPLLSISALDNQAAETVSGAPANTGTFRISRVGSTTSPLTVYFDRKGKAKFGSKADYTLSVNGTPLTGKSVVIPAGQGYVDITVSPVDDLKAEKSETVVLTLKKNSTYNLSSTISELTATVTILDNDL
jgi:hypothetical protein